MDVSHLVKGLNEEQQQAVCAPEGHALVIAGAGSGKTRVLVHRIAWLIEVMDVSPHSILAITFTNKAANEMKTRIGTLLKQEAGGVWCGTFHATCRRILSQHHKEAGLIPNFTIMDSADQKRFVKRIVQRLNMDLKKFPPEAAIGFINRQKEQGKRATDVDKTHDYMHNQLLKIYLTYEETAREEHLLDFAELMLRAYELLTQNKAVSKHYAKKFRYILVDEFQDTNVLQCALIKALQGDEKKNYVMAVGDEDQSIYGWRGADISNILNFDKMFEKPQVFRLERNYRSTQNILTAANALIAQNKDRLGKKLWSDKESNELIGFFRAPTDRLEAEFIIDTILEQFQAGRKLGDCAIFYRANAQSRIIEETLVHRNIPYRVYGGLRFYDRAEVKNVIGYMRLLTSADDNEAFRRIVNLPARGIGPGTLEKISYYSESHGVSLWHAAHRIAGGEDAGLLAPRALTAVRQFVELIDKMRGAIQNKSLTQQTALIIKLSGLEEFYSSTKTVEAESARENLKEFINTANQSFGGEPSDDMAIFLNNIALESGVSQAGEHQDAIQLMTLHASKGLEFPLVFMSGMEEGLFPSERSTMEPGKLEEERRLCYVGMTRACDRLYLTCCESRRLYGQEAYNPVSRFLEEIPEELLNDYKKKRRSAGRHEQLASVSLKPGQRVKHPTFGCGVVTKVDGNASHSRIAVDFDEDGSKWLILEYAELELLG